MDSIVIVLYVVMGLTCFCANCIRNRDSSAKRQITFSSFLQFLAFRNLETSEK